jgi:hypothetical protein
MVEKATKVWRCFGKFRKENTVFLGMDFFPSPGWYQFFSCCIMTFAFEADF